MKMAHKFQIRQINLHHCKEATSVLRCNLDSGQTGVSLIQEPYLYKGMVRGLGSAGQLHYIAKDNLPVRACVYTYSNVNAILLQQFSNSDFVAVQIKYSKNSEVSTLICCSAYLPYDHVVPTPELLRIVKYCKDQNLNLLIGSDANAHHCSWGSSDINSRGEKLLEFIVESDLIILNRGNRPTFINKVREEVIDLTLCSSGLVDEISDWHVSQEFSFSDHQTICFSIFADKVKPIPFRNPRKTNWELYKRKLSWRLGEWNSCIRNVEDIEREVDNLTDSLIFSYEESCPLRVPGNRRKTPWFSKDLQELKAKCNKAWNHRHSDYESFKIHQRIFKKACRSAKRRSLMEFCESI